MVHRPGTVEHVLERAILESGMTRYSIWRQTGIDQSTLSRFLAGKHGLNLDAVNKLMDLFDLELRPRSKRRQKKGG